MRWGAVATPTLIPATKIGRKSIRFLCYYNREKRRRFPSRNTPIYFFFSVVYIGSFSLGLVYIEIYHNPKGNYPLYRFNQTCNRIEIGISCAVGKIARRFLNQSFMNQSAERFINRAFVDATILADGTT